MNQPFSINPLHQTVSINPDTLKGFKFILTQNRYLGRTGGSYIRLPIFQVKYANHNMYFYSKRAKRKTTVRVRYGENSDYIQIPQEFPEKYLLEQFSIDRMVVSEVRTECNGDIIAKWFIDEMDVTLPEDDYIYRKEI